MRPEDRDAASLWDALEAAKRISTDVSKMSFNEYVAMTRAAVERELTLIAEALKRLSESGRKAHPEIAIPAIIGLRNRIIHEYETIEQAKIYSIATERIPELIAQLSPLIPPVPPDPESDLT